MHYISEIDFARSSSENRNVKNPLVGVDLPQLVPIRALTFEIFLGEALDVEFERSKKMEALKRNMSG
jgi:hypothetical protein